eukprot:CAMPEP_0117675146 /NCGR_PEP_ID=MMETSP0804-20121206/15443_1 /TAXON_ID=1074897 /ORGANISM="Tetraselmis astigmatica, Strain CCMP880" /LENGTH=75 /DNA_ID=CAMNT_0005484117 /DNA_START=205 /DNA_END=432 /DNA_ORIENTATION=+
MAKAFGGSGLLSVAPTSWSLRRTLSGDGAASMRPWMASRSTSTTSPCGFSSAGTGAGTCWFWYTRTLLVKGSREH